MSEVRRMLWRTALVNEWAEISLLDNETVRLSHAGQASDVPQGSCEAETIEELLTLAALDRGLSPQLYQALMDDFDLLGETAPRPWNPER